MVTVTSIGLIFNVPSTILNVTVPKLLFVLVKLAAVRFMLYVPTFVPLAVSQPLNVKSAAVYNVVGSSPILIEVTS